MKNSEKIIKIDVRQFKVGKIMFRFRKFLFVQGKVSMRKLFIVTALLTLFGLSSSVRAEEGMWLFSSPPAQEVKTKYGFELTPKFLEHLQKSSIRFSNGGSASFVSSNGLIMTNHHIAESSLNKLSTPEKNLLENGFYAATLEEELKCPELELRVLLKIADLGHT